MKKSISIAARVGWVILTLLPCYALAQAEHRVALVIGNAAYKSNPLKNPSNDARDFATNLRSYGFSVIEKYNLTTKQVGPTLREFRSKLTTDTVAVVFYAGHGLQVKGENYLPTVDADITGEEDIPTQSMSTRQIMEVLSDAKTRMNLVFLDACRDNPYTRSFRSSSRGLSKENAPSGTLISFATRPGSVAGDGDGRNGWYTGVLLEQMKQGDKPIEQVLKKVVTGVKVISKGQQEPWIEGSIEGDFCFQKCLSGEKSSAANSSVDPRSDDRLLWDAVKDSQNPKEFLNYLNKFPSGLFSELARTRLENLQSGQSVGKTRPISLSQSTTSSAQSVENDFQRAMQLVRSDNSGRNDVEAVRLFRMAADQGHAGAQAGLGEMYELGRGGLKKDEVEAVRLYRLSADQGNPIGQTNLGVMYLYGKGGLRKNEIQALKLQKLSASQGHVLGKARLKELYRMGFGEYESEDW